MVKVISKTEIENENIKQIVSDKKDKLDISNMVKPPKAPKALKLPRRSVQRTTVKRSPPPELIKMLEQRRSTPQYTEYKDTIGSVINNSLSYFAKDSNQMQNKIASSKDINSILKRRVYDKIECTSDVAVVGMTVLSYYLESFFI